MKPENFLLYNGLLLTSPIISYTDIEAIPYEIHHHMRSMPRHSYEEPKNLRLALEARHGPEAAERRKVLLFVAAWSAFRNTHPLHHAAVPCLAPFSLEEGHLAACHLLETRAMASWQLRNFEGAHTRAARGAEYRDKLYQVLRGWGGLADTPATELFYALCAV